jgi:DNA modification methylase/ParB-like chromosome segregation protein Spo0J
MAQTHLFLASDIVIKANRQRVEANIDKAKILKLAEGILKNGLLHAVVLRSVEDVPTLVVGRRRIAAILHINFLKKEVRYGGEVIPPGYIPCNYVGDLDPIDAEEAELSENLDRENLTWKEQADAIARLADLRARQAKMLGRSLPTTAELTQELKPEIATPGKATAEFASTHEEVRKDIILGNALRDPKKAAAIGGATSKSEALKLLKRHDEQQKHIALGAAIGTTFNAGMHQLLKGDCLHVMAGLPEASYDVICTDPPYGIDAQDYGDSGGKTGGGHFYDDQREGFLEKIEAWIPQMNRLAKPQAHLYWFCDVEWFSQIRLRLMLSQWDVFRTPLIWVNPTAMRAPWPEHGPQRKWQMILYAVRGKKTVTRLYSDVLTYPSDQNLGHQAQKPVALYEDLIRRSVRPGDSVLDPFCGTGPIFPACHKHQCKATGIEGDDAAFGIATKRLGEIK